MTVTALDATTALLLVDLQKGIVALPTAHPAEGVISQAAALAAAFRQHALPVVLIHVTGGAPGRTGQKRDFGNLPPDWADFTPGLNQQPQDHVVTKKTWGAFTNTGLDELLKKLDVTQVVIGGIATSIGVESTARQAYENHYNVTLATDAMTDMSLDAHTNSITRIFPRLGETGTIQAIIELLGKRGA